MGQQAVSAGRTGQRSRAQSWIALAAAVALGVTACGSDPQAAPPVEVPAEPEGTDQPEGTDEPPETEQEQPDTLAEFCAGDPEIQPEDEDRILHGVNVIMGEDPEQVPVPYFEQLEQSAEFQPATVDGPAEGVEVPVFSALICDSSSDGAYAALSHWFEFLHYSELVRDNDLLTQLHMEDCRDCVIWEEDVAEMAQEDQWLVDGEITGELYVSMPVGDQFEAVVDLVADPYDRVDADGVVTTNSEGILETNTFELVFDEDQGHWRVAEIGLGFVDTDPGNGGDDDGPPPGAGEAPEPPEMPAEVEEHTPEGALAAMNYWLAVFDYSGATGDMELAEEMMHPEWGELETLFEGRLELLEEENVTIALDTPTEISDIRVWQGSLPNPDAGMVSGQLVEGQWTAYTEDGSVFHVNRESQIGTTTYMFIYNQDVGHWQAAETGGDEPEEVFELMEIDVPDPDLTSD
ncbi:DUF6318 family protein [Nesterenkonia ebinurensis]|uniref:DUF6318 family protein n=1 Tax=Nesterenkonia ebinurensis TaxID=2608252 RepID=UPI00123CB656|nr:DUF6318 family protein [Nesterenkonia ebinurensis]